MTENEKQGLLLVNLERSNQNKYSIIKLKHNRQAAKARSLRSS